MYLIAGFIAFFPAFIVAVAFIYSLDFLVGGGLLHTSGLLDQIVVFVTWFLLTNKVFRWLQARQKSEKEED